MRGLSAVDDAAIEQTRFDMAVRYVTKSVRCISCKMEPVRLGMTCGDVDCIAKWLRIDTTNASYNRHKVQEES